MIGPKTVDRNFLAGIRQSKCSTFIDGNRYRVFFNHNIFEPNLLKMPFDIFKSLPVPRIARYPRSHPRQIGNNLAHIFLCDRLGNGPNFSISFRNFNGFEFGNTRFNIKKRDKKIRHLSRIKDGHRRQHQNRDDPENTCADFTHRGGSC